MEEKDLGDNLLLIAGEAAETYLQDTWIWDGVGEWQLDFGSGSSVKDYVNINSEVSICCDTTAGDILCVIAVETAGHLR